MKVLIVSDSHGLTMELQLLIEKHRNEVDCFIHCGDSELLASDLIITEYEAVRGNCDLDDQYPEEIIKKINNRTIFVTHGHKYSVKTNLIKLSYKATEVSADIVCFGHSHQLGVEMVHGKLFINPGSIRLPRGRKEKTYIILTILENNYQVDVYDIDNGKIPGLSHNFSLSN